MRVENDIYGVLGNGNDAFVSGRCLQFCGSYLKFRSCITKDEVIGIPRMYLCPMTVHFD